MSNADHAMMVAITVSIFGTLGYWATGWLLSKYRAQLTAAFLEGHAAGRHEEQMRQLIRERRAAEVAAQMAAPRTGLFSGIARDPDA